MQTEELKIGDQSTPRFEFRTFGQNFDEAAKKMAELSMPVPEAYKERHSDELYILSRNNDEHNIKIRDGKIDIKSLLQTTGNLEQWKPLFKAEFPINVEMLQEIIIPALKVKQPNLEKVSYSKSDFFQMVISHPALMLVRVHKQRFAYLVNNVICETGIVFINGMRISTISAESAYPEAVNNVIKVIGLEGAENINYLQAIKRVIGMVDEPLEN